MWRGILWIASISCGYRFMLLVSANALPTAVQLGGAIVAAVEEDVEQEEALKELHQRHQNDIEEKAFWTSLRNDPSVMMLARAMKDLEQGRGKFHRRRKLLKYLYPLLVGLLIVKTILLPLLLKTLTALSTSSFVMSKIALATAGLLALKWLLAGSGGYEGTKERTHFEIVHLPPYMKSYNRQGGLGGAGWSDSTLSGSNVYDVKMPKKHNKYIPLGSLKDNVMEADASSSSSYQWGYPPQHNYDGGYDGKPFL